jgi:UDP-glucuronate 4-epimerase
MSNTQIKDLVLPNFYRTFNLGNNESKTLIDYVEQIEKATGVFAKKSFLEMQRGDVLETCADNKSLLREFGDYNFTQIDVGIKKFVEWYEDYYRP